MGRGGRATGLGEGALRQPVWHQGRDAEAARIRRRQAGAAPLGRPADSPPRRLLVRRNRPVVAGGRITAHPRWSRVRRKWVQPEASQNLPDAEGEAADTFHRPQAVDGRLTRKELIAGQGGSKTTTTPVDLDNVLAVAAAGCAAGRSRSASPSTSSSKRAGRPPSPTSRTFTRGKGRAQHPERWPVLPPAGLLPPPGMALGAP